MAYYDALIAHWPGVSGATTQIKLNNINAETVTGQVPTVFSVSATDLFSAFDAGEWNALRTSVAAVDVVKVSLITDIIRLPGPIPVGQGTTANLLLFYVFGSSPQTLLNLGKLAVGQVQPWWQANGYPRPFDLGDIAAAGLS